MKKKEIPFEKLFATSGSAAQETLIAALISLKIARNRDDAISKIDTISAKDTAGIKRAILAGLESLAKSLKISSTNFINETNLELLKMATSHDIVIALDTIHDRFVKDSICYPEKIVEMYFNGFIYKLKDAYNLPWNDVKNDLVYIQHYLIKGGNTVPHEEIEGAFKVISSATRNDFDILVIASELYHYERFIDHYIDNYKRSLNPGKKDDAEIIKSIHNFLNKNKTNKEMIETIVDGLYSK